MKTKSNNKFIYKCKRVLSFMSLLSVEPYMFLVMFVFAIKRVPTDQLVQDKICLQKYNLTADYCRLLPHMKPEDDYENKKSLVLGDMTKFSLYTSVTAAVPSIITALFIGSWTDKYMGAKKVMMIMGGLAGLLEQLLLMLNVYLFDQTQMYILFSLIPSALSGGILSLFTAFYAYISSTTPTKLRALRMTIAEITLFAAIPLGTYIGGKVLNTKPLLKNGQLHNYTTVYLISAGAYLIAIFCSIFMVNEKKDIRKFNERFNKKSTELEMKAKEPIVCEKQKQFDDNKHIHPIKLLFSLSNVSDIVNTCCKKRDNYVRLQIWLLFISMLCYLMTHMGPGVFLFPFVEKVYAWNSEVYSNASAIGNVITALSTIFIAPILIKVIKIRDTNLSMIGVIAYFAQNMIRALILTPSGFYISLLAGAMGSVTSVGIRTHFSKIVEPKELGRVFSLMSAIDSIVPMIASALFTTIFNATMDTMPGLSFIVVGGILLFPFCTMIWIDIYTVDPNSKKDKVIDNNENKEVFTVETKM